MCRMEIVFFELKIVILRTERFPLLKQEMSHFPPDTLPTDLSFHSSPPLHCLSPVLFSIRP